MSQTSRKEYMRVWRANNRERKNKLDQAWRERNRDRINARNRELNKLTGNATNRMRAWRVKNPKKTLLQHAASRAKQLGVKFNLTVEDIVIPKRCPVFGFFLRKNVQHPSRNSPTLDRINPKKGYIAGNVVVISHYANMIKNVGTAAEHHRVAEWIENCTASLR